jgi:hypothetical protein
MSIAHLLYVPAVLVVGIALGYVLGARAVRSEFDRLRQRAKR